MKHISPQSANLLSLLGTPSLQAWPSRAPATKPGFSPWGTSSLHRQNTPKGKLGIVNVQQALA
jgi:hypothetical protein